MRHAALAVLAILVAACAAGGASSPNLPAPSDVPSTVVAVPSTPTGAPSATATPEPTPSPSAQPSATATPQPTPRPTPRPTPKPTLRPTPKPTFNPSWTVKAKVGNGVLTPSAGTAVDTVTWRVLSATNGARCELYLYFYTGGPGSSTGGEPVNNGNQTGGGTYRAGASNTFVLQLAPDQHDEYATYTLGCWLSGGAKRWATPGQISIQ